MQSGNSNQQTKLEAYFIWQLEKIKEKFQCVSFMEVLI